VDAGVPAPTSPLPATPATPPKLEGATLQDAVLARAVFLARRDVCVLVDADAPLVPSWDTNASGVFAPMKTQVGRCHGADPLHALLAAGASAVALAHDKAAPSPITSPLDFAAIDRAWTALLGRPLTLAREPTAVPGETLQRYDPAAIEAAFTALYAKPSDKRLGLPLRALFDATLKDALAAQLRDLELVIKNRKLLASEAKKLNDGAKKPGTAQGKDAWRAALNRLVTSDEHAAHIDPRLVGFALRRQADGTLDVILTCLRTILTDYGAP
jgi:hypothetical protein